MPKVGSILQPCHRSYQFDDWRPCWMHQDSETSRSNDTITDGSIVVVANGNVCQDRCNSAYYCESLTRIASTSKALFASTPRMVSDEDIVKGQQQQEQQKPLQENQSCFSRIILQSHSSEQRNNWNSLSQEDAAKGLNSGQQSQNDINSSIELSANSFPRCRVQGFTDLTQHKSQLRRHSSMDNSRVTVDHACGTLSCKETRLKRRAPSDCLVELLSSNSTSTNFEQSPKRRRSGNDIVFSADWITSSLDSGTPSIDPIDAITASPSETSDSSWGHFIDMVLPSTPTTGLAMSTPSFAQNQDSTSFGHLVFQPDDREHDYDDGQSSATHVDCVSLTQPSSSASMQYSLYDSPNQISPSFHHNNGRNSGTCRYHRIDTSAHPSCSYSNNRSSSTPTILLVESTQRAMDRLTVSDRS